jgi:hypothetical protein
LKKNPISNDQLGLTARWTAAARAQESALGDRLFVDPVGFLSMLGWKASLSQAGAPDANHGRWHLPVDEGVLFLMVASSLQPSKKHHLYFRIGSMVIGNR